MNKRIRHSINAPVSSFGGDLTFGAVWQKRLRGIFMLILFMPVLPVFSQTIEFPLSSWPLDSVINGAVKHFTVQGDQNYDEPSTFTWTVYGGRLFLDEDTTQIAGDGTTATVTGDSATNITEMWVVWDVFTAAVDTGYIYVTELSADGCQKPDADTSKYRGMTIKVKAPPDVWFLTDSTLTCSYDGGVDVQIGFNGFTPFDLTYVVDGDTLIWHVTASDVVDSDLDGNEDNLIISFNDYTGTTEEIVHNLELIESESEGVEGEILQYPTHTVYVYVQPRAPDIAPTWTQVTTGLTHTYTLSDEGEDPLWWYWYLIDENNSVVFDTTTTTGSVDINLNFTPGNYQLICYYSNQSESCLSPEDTLAIEIYARPTIAFITDNAYGCSQTSDSIYDNFDFDVDYEGAPTYSFIYEIYDYNGNVAGGDTLSLLSEDVTISVPNTFVNDAEPEINRNWEIKITWAENEEGVEAEIEEGEGERLIIIHPKPVIYDDIDFAN